jgi:hypothetical protein
MNVLPVKGIIAICVGYGAGIRFSILAIRKQTLLDRSQRWLSAPGRILESTLIRNARGHGSFRIRYEFYVGERIESSTPRLSGKWFWTSKQEAAFVSRYASSQEVEVFYDSRDPKQNCLDRTDRSGITVMWLLALGGIFLGSILVWLLFQQ